MNKLKQTKGKKRNMEGGSNYTKLIIFLLSCSFLLSFHHVQAQEPLLTDCSNSEKYTSNTQFEANLNLLLRFLVVNGPRGAFNDTIGFSPDRVYGLAQCRGDMSVQDCGTCLNTASVEILERCPYRKSATLRYEYCILRYSNSKFSGEVDRNFGVLYNTENVSDADSLSFYRQWSSLMSNLSTWGAIRDSKELWGSIDYKPTTRIYGLEQCTRDLSNVNCFSCLQYALTELERCCERSKGAQIYSTTCYVRYELYSFVQRQTQQVDALWLPSSTNKTELEQDGNWISKPTNVDQ